jgi:hypothetical protein
MGSIAKLAKRALETEAPVMVKVILHTSLLSFTRPQDLSSISRSNLVTAPFLSSRYKSYCEGPRM